MTPGHRRACNSDDEPELEREYLNLLEAMRWTPWS
jgi:hypothetical protein